MNSRSGGRRVCSRREAGRLITLGNDTHRLEGTALAGKSDALLDPVGEVLTIVAAIDRLCFV